MAALAGAALLGACADASRTATEPVRVPEQDLVERVVAMGFARDRIVDRGDHFLVEGDIRIGKAGLRGQPRGQRVVSTVGSSRRTITVNVSALASVSTSWANATRDAMANWSAMPGADITFVETTGSADVTVLSASWGNTGNVAQGSFPSGGAPGVTVTVNDEYLGTYAYARQVWIMTHELGHNLGLAHTNTSDGSHIAGTPTTDSASVMNDGSFYGGNPPNAPSWSAFSPYDEAALRALYPLPAVTGLTATNAGGEVFLAWNAVAGAVSYELQRTEYTYHSASGVSTWDSGWDISSSTNSYDTDAYFTGTSYCYWDEGWYYFYTYFNWEVRAVFANGKRSAVTLVPTKEVFC